MDQATRRWMIVPTIFIVLFFVMPALGINGVFFTPLLKEFGGSRARISTLLTMNYLAGALLMFASGWLLDFVEARYLIIVGALLVGAGNLVAGRADSFLMLGCGYVMTGAGAGMAGQVTAAVVISNWFAGHRAKGLALGLALTGLQSGDAIMALLAAHIMVRHGWRAAFLMMSVVPLLILPPLALIVVRTRPPGAEVTGLKAAAPVVPGVDLGEVLRSRSLWLLIFASLCTGYVHSEFVHLAPDLIGMKYTPQQAALALSVMLLAAGSSMPICGAIADRIGVRPVLSGCYALGGVMSFTLIKAASPVVLVSYAILFGCGGGAPTTLVQLLITDCFGLKRYGTLGGLMMITGYVSGFDPTDHHGRNLRSLW